MSRSAKRGKPGLRMNELVRATGAPKSTIAHYVNEGLLPAPVKTSPNMAYYDPSCIDLINYIKMLQSRYHLPLPRIKEIIDSYGMAPESVMGPLVELSELIFGPLDKETVSLEEFCEQTGFSPEEVTELIKARMLIPMEPDRFDQEDVIMGGILARGKEMGLTAEESSFYTEAADRIVDHEFELRDRLTAALPADQDAVITATMTRTARIMRSYIIDRVFQKRALNLSHLKGTGPAARDMKK